MSQTILISAFQAHISKNILNTDALAVLRSQDDVHVVIITIPEKVDFFRKVYCDKNVQIVGLDAYLEIQQNKAYRLVKYLAFLAQKSHYNRYRRIEAYDRDHSVATYIRYRVLEELSSRIICRIPGVTSLLRFFLKLIDFKSIRNIFEEYKPTKFFSTDIFDYFDTPMLSEAKKLNIDSVGMIRSWDNCWSKGRLLVLPDWLLVHNPTIADEAASLHGMPSDKISVCGMPQFDAFIRGFRKTREEFCTEMGLDQSKKIILFAPAGTLLSDTDGDICSLFVRWLGDGSIRHPAQVMVRNHPNHPADLKEYSDRLVVEVPGKVFKPGNIKAAELTLSDAEHLADTLYHADVVIYVATTLGIDALVFDKPQIIVDFDGFVKKDYWHSVRRYHDEDHMKKMLACGGVFIAKDEDSLLRAINRYLDNPAADDDGRKRMFEQQIAFRDGKSGERVAKAVLEFTTRAS